MPRTNIPRINGVAALRKRVAVLRRQVAQLKKADSNQKRLESDLQGQKRFLTSILFSIQDGVSVLDKDMRIILANPAIERLYAHSMPLAGKKCYQAYRMRNSICEACPTIRTLKEGGAAHEVVPKIGKDGEITGWLDLFSFPLVDPRKTKVIGAIEYVRDITDRCRAEEEIRELVKRLGTVIERIDEGIALTDDKGRYLIFNSKMGDITGYTMQEANAHGDLIDRICPEPEERRKALRCREQVKNKRDIRNLELTIRSKNGTVKTLLVSMSLMAQHGEDMLLFVYRDISSFRQLAALKDEFIGIVSHELRTPLSIVKEGISLVLDSIPGPINSSQAKVLASARANIDRLGRIINNLLDISKIESGKFEVNKSNIDLAEIASQVVASFGQKAKDKGLAIGTDLPSSGAMVYADPDMLTQVITNLIDNALKFTAAGRIEVKVTDEAKRVVCSVADSGPGIARENMPMVFGKFQQFSRTAGPGERGTGLGLAIAKKVVEVHHGRISAQSDIGKGTKITFTLPKLG